MRKLLLSVFCVVVALFLVVGCASIKVQKGVVLNLAAQSSGFMLAQEEPELAKDILKASQIVLDVGIGNFTKPTFQAWTESVIEKLAIDPFLKMNFKEMIKLVEIEITLAEDQQEVVQLAYAVIQNFIKGIKARE